MPHQPPRPTPPHPHRVHPPAADLFFGLGPPLTLQAGAACSCLDHPPDPRARPTAAARGEEHTDAADMRLRLGSLNSITISDLGCGRRLGGLGSRATERRPSLHRGRLGCRLSQFPLAADSVRPFLLASIPPKGGMTGRKASVIGRPQSRGLRTARTVAVLSPAPRVDWCQPSRGGTPALDGIGVNWLLDKILGNCLISFWIFWVSL